MATEIKAALTVVHDSSEQRGRMVAPSIRR